MDIVGDIAARLDVRLNEIRATQGEEAAKMFINRVREWLSDTQPNRLTLHRDHPNKDGWSYRPDPDKLSRVFVPTFLCGSMESAPRTIVIEGLPPYDAVGDRLKRKRNRNGQR